MKKLIFSLILFSTMATANAYEAVVIVLEAPLLQYASLDSKVISRVRKGERINIPKNIVTKGSIPEFIPVIDRAGNRVFVPSRYLKIIYKDQREYNNRIAFEGNDPTDYRIEEPIGKNYPHTDSHILRASFSAHFGTNTNSQYFYENQLNDQSNMPEMGLRTTLLFNAEHDVFDRFYFGMIGFINSTKNNLNFSDNSTSKESRDIYRIGPLFQYDSYKTAKHRLSLGLGFTYNLHKTVIEREDSLNIETRIFSGYSFSPIFNISYIRHDVIPNTDFVAGFDASLYLPHKLISKDEATNPIFWGESNEITAQLKGQVSSYIGVQFKY